MNESNIVITFSAADLEGVQKFTKLILDNVGHSSASHSAVTKEVQTTEGPCGTYAVGCVELTVLTEKLNSCLVQLDAVEQGFVPDAEDVMENVFGDMRAEVVHADENRADSLLQMNTYLHNKVQEQNQTIQVLSGQMNAMFDMVGTNQQAVLKLQESYERIQTFLHSYVNIVGLMQTVRALAEQVDPDLLDDYTEHTIH